MEQVVKIKYILWIVCFWLGLQFLSAVGFVNLPQSFDAQFESDRAFDRIRHIESVLTQSQRCDIEKLENKEGWYTTPSQCK